MKRVLSALILTSYLVIPALVIAQEEAPIIVESPEDLLAKISTIGNWVFTFLLAVAGIFLIIAGFFFITAGGNPEQVNKARQMLINALIGVAVALGAKGMIAMIQNILA